MRTKSLEERVTLLENLFAGMTLEEHFRQQAELLDLRFLSVDERFSTSDEHFARVDAQLSVLTSSLAIVASGCRDSPQPHGEIAPHLYAPAPPDARSWTPPLSSSTSSSGRRRTDPPAALAAVTVTVDVLKEHDSTSSADKGCARGFETPML